MDNLIKQIEALQTELKKIKKELKEANNNLLLLKRGRAKKGDIYYFITYCGRVFQANEIRHADNNAMFEFGNYFLTKADAETRLMQLQIEQELKDIALELNNGNGLS